MKRTKRKTRKTRSAWCNIASSKPRLCNLKVLIALATGTHDILKGSSALHMTLICLGLNPKPLDPKP